MAMRNRALLLYLIGTLMVPRAVMAAGEIHRDKDPWNCIELILKAVQYAKYPTVLIREAWDSLTAPDSVQNYSEESFNKSKRFYHNNLKGSGILLTPKTFEEKMAFIEVQAEGTGLLPLNLGKIMTSISPTSKKRLGKILDSIDVSKGLTEEQLYRVLTILYEIQYRAPSKLWGDVRIEWVIKKRIQVELTARKIKWRLELLDQLLPETGGELAKKAWKSREIQALVTLTLNSVAIKTAIPTYLPKVKDIKIPGEMITQIQTALEQGKDPTSNLEKLKSIYGSKINWSSFYTQFRKYFIIGAVTLNVVYGMQTLRQQIIERDLKDVPDTENILIKTWENL